MRKLGVRDAAARPVSGQSLVFFRIVFGAVVAVSAIRLLLTGWAVTLYGGPDRHFSYPAMGWVPVPSALMMQVLIAGIAVSAVLVVFGYRYRISIAVLWVLFTWMEFTEATVYLNHYWFVSVMGALLVVLPMDSAGPVPVGAVWLVRFQVAVVYVFAGIAKLHTDWLANGLPMSLWLGTRSDLPLIGGLLEHPGAAVVLSVAGALFDCLIVAFLLWHPTRFWAWLVVVAFHLATWVLFPIIGVFPFLMIGASSIFFDPDWPTKFGWQTSVGAGSKTGPVATPAPVPRKVPRLMMGAAALWIALQLLLPLRHFLYPDDSRWTGEGFRFSWNVLAIEKAGDVTFRVTDTRTGDTIRTDGTDLFTPQQWRTMATDPELIRQAAHEVAQSEAATRNVSVSRLQVRVDAFVSLNGRSAQRMIDPDVDLASQPAKLGHQSWIRPAR